MPTKRGYRGRGKKKDMGGEGDYSMGKKVAEMGKKGIEAYLSGTQKMADKIEGALPESMKSGPRSSSGGRRGRGRRSMLRKGRGG